MDDFRKFATKHLGMSSMVLDDVIISEPLYFGRTSVECDTARCILAFDDGQNYLFGYRNQ